MRKFTKRYIIAKCRSEQGKMIRRQYKNDKGVPYQLCKGHSLMLGGYSNTITTFCSVDNQIMELKENINMDLTYHEHPTKGDLLEYFGQRIKIRKMTAKESFRLMSVGEADIEKIQSYPFTSYAERDKAIKKAIDEEDKKELNRIKRESICKTAQYRLVGNSIVTDCLFHIFRTLFIPDQPENGNTQRQLSLFNDYEK